MHEKSGKKGPKSRGKSGSKMKYCSLLWFVWGLTYFRNNSVSEGTKNDEPKAVTIVVRILDGNLEGCKGHTHKGA